MRKKLLLAALAIGVLLALTPVAAAAGPPPSRSLQDGECTHPIALMLSQWMEVPCDELVALHDQGVGFGVMMRAYFLSTVFPELEWEDLVQRHLSEEGLGWGQIMKAHLLAQVLGADPESLLAEHAAGKGWGEILQEYREEPGKPPWAGQGKPPWAGRGKPPWAGPPEPEGTEQ